MDAHTTDGDVATTGEPWPLPPGWAWAKLGGLGKWTGGGTPSKAIEGYWRNGSIPWVSPKDMKSESIRETEDHITEEAVRGSTTKFVAPGSILMVMRSGILRHTFPVGVNLERVTINQDLRALTPASALDPNFIAHYLRSIQRQILHDCSKDGTTVQSIEASALERIWVPVAPAPEQRRIVARIHELFAEIAEGEAALERARAGLDTWRRALLKAAVTGELTRDWREGNKLAQSAQPTDRADAIPAFHTELPPSWRWCRVDGAGLVTLGRQRAPQHHSGPYLRPYLRVANVMEDRLDLSDVKQMNFNPDEFKTFSLRPGDVLLNEGQSYELVGRSAIFRGEIDGSCFQNTLIRFRASSGVLPEYAQIYFRFCLHNGLFSKVATITTNIAHLSRNRFASMAFPLPPTEEQKQIVEIFASAEAGITDLGRLFESRDRAALRQSILNSAFEGCLVPQDPSDEPASVLLARLRAEMPVEPPRGRSRKKADAASNRRSPPLSSPAKAGDPVTPGPRFGDDTS